MKRIILFGFLIGFIFSTNIFAQRGFETSSQDFTLKFSPGQISVGEFAIGFEAKITPKSSIEVNLAPTFGGFALAPLMLLDKNEFSNFGLPFNSRLGVSFSAAYRYYVLRPNDSEMRGLYLSPVLKFKFLSATKAATFVPDELDEYKMNQFGGSINVGYQFIFKSGFVLDMFAGTGISNKNYNQRKHFDFYDDNNNVFKYVNILKKSKILPYLTVGVRIGFGGNYK